jgi:very-short-patch-repair endonuclease
MGMAEQERQRLLEAARKFRQFPTLSEELLWQELRRGSLGVRFRRQHSIGPLVVDFCCPRLRLIVEVDGSVHQQQQERDAARQRLLEGRAYQVLRFTAAEVEADLTGVVERISTLVREHLDQVPLSHAGRGGWGRGDSPAG